ncbi:heme biosynthesis operon protein HemX, partial [Pseudomonas syringae pv. tagetis]
PEPVRTERTGSRSSGLVFMALLIGIAGIAVAGWGDWQLRMLQAGHQQQLGQVEDNAEQPQFLAQYDQQFISRLEQF